MNKRGKIFLASGFKVFLIRTHVQLKAQSLFFLKINIHTHTQSYYNETSPKHIFYHPLILYLASSSSGKASEQRAKAF